MVRAAVVLGVIASLTGCQYVDRIALRLNDDQSVDMLSCETLDRVKSARAYLDQELTASFDADELVRTASGFGHGDVVRLADELPGGDWKVLSLGIDGVFDSSDWTISGSFRREDLRVGEWAWARTGIFIGTVAVDGCEADY
jgi:hypothetical protein